MEMQTQSQILGGIYMTCFDSKKNFLQKINLVLMKFDWNLLTANPRTGGAEYILHAILYPI